jgi:hypothetical protein
MERALHKGVPPLFKELKGFYKNKDKIAIIENLCLSYVENLKTISFLNRKFNIIFYVKNVKFIIF